MSDFKSLEIFKSKEFKNLVKCLKQKNCVDKKFLSVYDKLTQMKPVDPFDTPRVLEMLKLFRELTELTSKQRDLECKYNNCLKETITFDKYGSQKIIKDINKTEKIIAQLGKMKQLAKKTEKR